MKFSSQGFQSIQQHSKKPKHKTLSDICFGNTVCHFQSTSSTSSSTTDKNNIVTLSASFKEKVSAAEAMWVFKVSEEDMTFRDCDNTPALFQNMFSDSTISKSFSMSREKASYILQDGLGPLLSKWLCKKIYDSGGAFTLMFDETTTEQRRKQMDLLIRYWDEDEEQVVTRYMTSLFFGIAKAIDITKMLTDLHDNKVFNLPWNRLFNISSDGPNINKAIWRELDGSLKERGYKGLFEFVNCTLHVIAQCFQKGNHN